MLLSGETGDMESLRIFEETSFNSFVNGATDGNLKVVLVSD